MVELTRIAIRDFLCFKDEELELSSRGLVGVLGSNYDAEASDSNGAGKCLPGWVKVYDPDRKEVVSIEKFVREKRKRAVGFSDWDLKDVKVSGWHELGEKEIYEISLSNGCSHKMAGSHPILTPSGCCRVDELLSGEYVAEIREFYLEGNPLLSSEEAYLLGMLLGDGCLTDGSVRFSCSDQEVLDKFNACLSSVFSHAIARAYSGGSDYAIVSSLGKETRTAFIKDLYLKLREEGVVLEAYIYKGNIYRFCRGDCSISFDVLCEIERDYGIDLSKEKEAIYASRAVRSWLERIGVWGKNAFSKVIPDEFLWMSDDATQALVAGLWATDGYVFPSGSEVSFCSSSFDLANNVRFLLQRLGIVSNIRLKHNKRLCRNYYNVIVSNSSFEKFRQVIPLVGKKERLLREICFARSGKSSNPNIDVVPPCFCKDLPVCSSDGKRHRTKKQLSKHGMSREMFKSWGGEHRIADAPIRWVKVSHVEKTGQIVNCYDITVDSEEHLYVADGLIVHNSAIFEAIYFGLFGKLIRPARIDEAIRIGSDRGIYISIWFKNEAGVEYRIERFHKDPEEGSSLDFSRYDSAGPVDLRGESKKETQARINGILGISPQLFQHVVLFGQGAMPRFSELGDSAKKELVEEVLGVSLYKRAEKEARRRYNSTVTGIADRQKESRMVGEQIDLALQRYEDSVEVKKSWSQERGVRLEKLSVEIEKMQRALDELGESGEEAILVDKIGELKERENEFGVELRELKEKKRRIRKAYNEKMEIFRTEESEVVGKLSFLNERRMKLGGLVFDGRCPECERPVDAGEYDFDSIDVSIRSYRKDLVGKEKEKKELEDAWVEISGEIDWEEEEVQDKARKVARARSTVEQRLATLKPQKDNLKKNIERLKMEQEEESTVVFSHEGKIEEALSEVERIKEKKDGLLEELDRMAQLKEKLNVLVNVFGPKGVRSFVFESLLDELNSHIIEYTDLVSGGSLFATISATSETASGEMRERISFDVVNMAGGSSYNLSSSGEKRRLDLPVSFALQDVAARRGIGLGICLLDEVFENLDEEGVRRVIGLLNKVSSRSFTQTVLVITHHDDMKAWFPELVQVVKQGGWSTIQELSE